MSPLVRLIRIYLRSHAPKKSYLLSRQDAYIITEIKKFFTRFSEEKRGRSYFFSRRSYYLLGITKLRGISPISFFLMTSSTQSTILSPHVSNLSNLFEPPSGS